MWAGSARRRDNFTGTQQHPQHLCEGWKRRSWVLHSSAWWEAKRQQHKLKQKQLRLEIRRGVFPMRTAQQWGWGPGKFGCLLYWGMSQLEW
ncbi:unnamed protein product, partial [Bubo scandiacus]